MTTAGRKIVRRWNQEPQLMSRTAEIKVLIDLDDDDVPTQIEWQASEAKDAGFVSCQTVMLSLWDSDNNTTASIDLWTKEITIDDMNLHFYQMLHKMADTYLRATKNPDMAKEIHSFADGFGSTLGLR
jgi:gliding motility-associated protein GldC